MYMLFKAFLTEIARHRRIFQMKIQYLICKYGNRESFLFYSSLYNVSEFGIVHYTSKYKYCKQNTHI